MLMEKGARGRRSLLAILLVAAGLLFWTTVSFAGVDATLTDDARVVPAFPSTNFGASANLKVRGSGPIRTFLKFDLSTLPPGTVGSDVSKATLTLWVNLLAAPGSVDVQPVSGTWDEGSITATLASSLSLGATVGTAAVSAAGKFVTVDVTSLVQDWVDGNVTNDGLALVANPGTPGVSVRFDSKENVGTTFFVALPVAVRGTN